MNREDFEEKMQRIDSDLIKEKISLQGRPFKALNIICPNSSFSMSSEDKKFFGEFEGPNLFDEIYSWYEIRYSKKILSNFTTGKKPFKLRGEIYYINYPVVLGTQVLVDVHDYVEDLTLDMRRSLSERERDKILEEYKLGYEAFSKIQNLSNFKGKLQDDTVDLLSRGIVDIEAAASTITDFQNTIFHSHQAAEKFLKALFVELEHENITKKNKTVSEEIRRFSHNISDIYERLSNTKLPNKKAIDSQVKYLHKLVPNMNIRYKEDDRKTLNEAISSVNNMLGICRFVSEQIIHIHP